MGVLLLEKLPSAHAFRAARRRAAVVRKDDCMATLQAETLQLKLEVAQRKFELRSWQEWYSQRSWRSHDTPQSLASVDEQASNTVLSTQCCRQCEGKVVVTEEELQEGMVQAVERALTEMSHKMEQQFESRFQKMIDEMADLRLQLGSIRQERDEARDELVEGRRIIALLESEKDELWDLHGGNCDGDDVEVPMDPEPGLMEGARIMVVGLQNNVELNGLRGTLKTFMASKDRWQVMLDSYSDIKLFRPANLISEPVGRHCEDGDAGLVRNDLGIFCDMEGRVDWELTIPCARLAQELLDEQRLGKWRCRECKQDLVDCKDNYGNIFMKDRAEDEWEEKHILALLEQPAPEFLRCIRCHIRSVPCKFYRRGFCKRGMACAYKHGGDSPGRSSGMGEQGPHVPTWEELFGPS